jgi:hypothetical protein
MKKIFCLVGCLVFGSANAAVLNFDDINPGANYVTMSSLGQSNYAGLSWDTDWYVGNTSVSSYGNAAHSGTQYLSNGGNVTNLSVGFGTLFDFDGAWFATPSHSNPAEWVNISAFDSLNNLIGTTGEVSINSTMSWVNAGFSDVAYLNITRGDGWFTMDDFTYNSSVNVPEPTSIVLFGLGLASIGFSRKKNS